jgi:hypothetical protein
MMEFKGVPPYPSSDAVGNPPLRTVPLVFTQPTFANQNLRAYGTDIYATAAGPKL